VCPTHSNRRAKKIGDRATALCVARRIRERLASDDLHLDGREPPGRVETVDTYADGWLRSTPATLKASTVRFYTDNLIRHVRPLLGARPVTSLTRADSRELIAGSRAKGQGLKMNTVRGIARTLSALLSQAVEDEKLPANPALRLGRYLRRGDEPKASIQPLTRAEAAHLVGVAREDFPRWTRGCC
jgi:hypothetical protein